MSFDKRTLDAVIKEIELRRRKLGNCNWSCDANEAWTGNDVRDEVDDTLGNLIMQFRAWSVDSVGGGGVDGGLAQRDRTPGKDGAEEPGAPRSRDGEGSRLLRGTEQGAFSPQVPGSSPGPTVDSTHPRPSEACPRCEEEDPTPGGMCGIGGSHPHPQWTPGAHRCTDFLTRQCTLDKGHAGPHNPVHERCPTEASTPSTSMHNPCAECGATDAPYVEHRCMLHYGGQTKMARSETAAPWDPKVGDAVLYKGCQGVVRRIDLPARPAWIYVVFQDGCAVSEEVGEFTPMPTGSTDLSKETCAVCRGRGCLSDENIIGDPTTKPCPHCAADAQSGGEK